jgi:tripartite-type tricarboxylate transporter receptor subunit TctC
MQHPTRKVTKLALLVAAGSALTLSMAAAEYPERPVTLIISSAPGSGGDTNARTYMPYLEKCLGTTGVIINRPGAGGALAHADLKAAAADGYTIGNINLPNTVAQAIEKGDPPPWETFDYVSNISSSRVGLHVATDAQWKTFEELLAYVKEHPKQVTLGLSGLGGDDHLTQLQAMRATGAEFTLVPMGDAATARAAMLGGHVDALSIAAYEALPYKDQLLGLWYAAEERQAAAPDVPTLRELGYDVIGGSNQVVGAPKGTPQEALDKLRGCYEQIFKDPGLIKEAEERKLPYRYMNAADTEAYAKQQWTALEEVWKTNPWK